VEYVCTFDFAAEGVRDPAEITARLRGAIGSASGWPMRD
jgi:hypothetical protein